MTIENVMEKPIYKCMTKVTTAEGDPMKYGPNWFLAERRILRVYNNRLEFGDCKISFSDISEATLYSIHSTLFIPGYILKISTQDKTYHFGLNWGSFWKRVLPFPVKRKKAKLGYTAFSVVVRMLLFGYLAYMLWAWFVK